MPNTPHSKRIDLQEVRNRNRIAREIVAGLSDRMPHLFRAWFRLNVALDDTPALAAEVTALDAQLVGARRDRANLIAAARATLNAHSDEEPDHLWYLRDELSAQGHHPPDSWGRA